MPNTTFRRDVTGNLATLCQDFINNNPTLALRVYRRRPTAFTGDLPAFYIGTRNEKIVHTSGLRQRTMAPQIGIAGHPTGTPDEIAAEMDELVDEFLDWVTTHPHAISSNTVTGVTDIRDIEIELDGVIYPVALMTLDETIALEGRS